MVTLLNNPIRDYAWGSPTAIPELIGTEPDGNPQAELWMGAHESGPSKLSSGESLYDLMQADPAGVLGEETAGRFDGRFPFLAKFLAAEQPLSLQAHPSLEQAREGFARDEEAGIPLDAADRNYKDPWPKPELLIALGRFDAVVGFRPIARTVALLDALAVNGLDELDAQLRDGKLREAFTRLMSSDRDAIRPQVAALGEACRRYDGSAFELEVQTLDRLSQDFPDDPGVLAALLLNRVRLERFESVYLPAGNVHAYLHGLGFEVLANSDNVLRGGLTRKHIDAPELVSVVDFEPLADPVLTPTPAGDGITTYETGCEYFAARRVDLAGADPAGADLVEVPATGPRIVACVEGTVTVSTQDDGPGTELTAGRSAFVRGPEAPCNLRGAGTAFVVSAR